jgi:hypothetical protein
MGTLIDYGSPEFQMTTVTYWSATTPAHLGEDSMQLVTFAGAELSLRQDFPTQKEKISNIIVAGTHINR